MQPPSAWVFHRRKGHLFLGAYKKWLWIKVYCYNARCYIVNVPKSKVANFYTVRPYKEWRTKTTDNGLKQSPFWSLCHGCQLNKGKWKRSKTPMFLVTKMVVACSFSRTRTIYTHERLLTFLGLTVISIGYPGKEFRVEEEMSRFVPDSIFTLFSIRCVSTDS